ncbi:MAG: hypothetical protein H7222_11780 [Methylotenera sp.]|nr:hypothetical protein [Oligoflexia bacterium]
MKKFSRSTVTTLLIATSFGVLTSSTAFAKSGKPWDGHAPDISGADDLTIDREDDVKGVLYRIQMDIVTQDEKATFAQQSISELANAPAPEAGKLAIGVGKLKNRFSIWNEKRKMKRALENEDAGKSTHEQEEISAQKSMSKISEINARAETAPAPTGLKKWFSRAKNNVVTAKKTGDLDAALDYRNELEIQKQIIDGYQSSDSAKSCLGRACLLARYKLVSDMIDVQRSMKLQNIMHLSKASDAEKANLEHLKIEKEVLAEVLKSRHDLEDSKIIDPNSPETSLGRVQKKLNEKREKDNDRIVAAQQLNKDLAPVAAAAAAGSAPARTSSASGLMTGEERRAGFKNGCESAEGCYVEE